MIFDPTTSSFQEKNQKQIIMQQEDLKMDKIIVAFWSQSGNTQAMANAIG